eukprot:605245-Pelagomonas_calceolata.AAC.3
MAFYRPVTGSRDVPIEPNQAACIFIDMQDSTYFHPERILLLAPVPSVCLQNYNCHPDGACLKEAGASASQVRAI